jgi:predicted nucleic acid-binding protein
MAKSFPRKALRIYADTSVFGGVFDPEFSAASSRFLDQVGSKRFQLVISPLVEEEISEAPHRVQDLYQSVAPLAELAPVAEAAGRLQAAYLRARIVSSKWARDALHVASASVAGCQIMVSWNFRHIVHYDKIALYNAINIREGYSPIGIHTPQEVIEYEKEEV